VVSVSLEDRLAEQIVSFVAQFGLQ